MKRLSGLVAVLGLTLSGCSAAPDNVTNRFADSYRLTAYFDRTIAFYEGSPVKVMGLDVGRVEEIIIVGAQVKVDFSVREDTPLPADVHAGIVPLNLVGERNLVLFPPWRKGAPRARDGAVIPRERTELPVEVDDALQAFTDLNNAFDPDVLSAGVSRAAAAFKGNGEQFNQVIQQSAEMTRTLAGQSDRLLKVAGDLNTLTGVVKDREKTLDRLLKDFGTVSDLLSEERRNIQKLVRALVDLIKRGDVLIKAYRERLPGDLANFTEIALTLKANSKAVADLLETLPEIGGVLVDAWDEKHHSLTLRIGTDAFIRAWMKPIFQQLGLKEPVPCLPEPFANCPWQED
ncbi:MCE family protein [Actinocorallia populi]|uniref:MCE family protein n=1 Tax=Actinocorallia populi TaxID=2079200 RepID=UPI001300933A|nr:MlaD family protein [Actinocorallia populi]